MGKMVSALSADGSVVCYAVDSTDIACRAEQVHHTSATVTAALGRLLTAASLMGWQLKSEDASVTLRLAGGGPAGVLIAVSDSAGNPRGYAENPVVEIPLNARGKLDVATAVGSDGSLYVMRDMGFGEPYIGQTPIVSGEIAEDITSYYAMSEQTPTVCALGVLVNTDLTVRAAGGFLAQLLPGAAEECIDILEANINNLPPVTQLLEDGKTPEDIALAVLEGLDASLVNEARPEYRCNCTRDRVERALLSLGADELNQMAGEQPVTEVSCHFCPKIYRFNSLDLLALLDSAKS